MKPPTMRALLDDPVYRKMFKTVPHLAPTLRHGEPWMVWGRLVDGRWRGGNFATYADAWRVVVKAVRSPMYEDVAIISRRQFYAPPANAVWDYPYEWCSRCRRPTHFMIRPRHHALRHLAVITTGEDAQRCYYCGQRRISMPSYHG